MKRISSIYEFFFVRQTSSAPLAFFRMAFGFVMFFSMVRFLSKGWVETLYIQPTHYFTYYGFGWVKPLGPIGMYVLIGIISISALGVGFGYFYRISSWIFFLSFTYMELIDLSNYLNHYYFIAIVAFLLCLVPAGNMYSLDVRWRNKEEYTTLPAWCSTIFQLQLAIVYFFAGVAKINEDWLLRAMPLRIWLPSKSDLPLIGTYLSEPFIAYAFSWAGMLYDVFIPFFLFWRRSVYWAIGFVVIFHILTSILFPMIGMFPFVMLMGACIFLPPSFHDFVFTKLIRWKKSVKEIKWNYVPSTSKKSLVTVLLVVHFVLQVVLPMRYLLYPGNLFWTEQGFRFSWRVMLMEKSGYATFVVEDRKSGKVEEIINAKFLTLQQEKMMATQPDMILQFAKMIKREYERKGMVDPSVRVECYVTLNGRAARPFIDSSVDLTKESEGFAPKRWILPYNY